MSYINYTGRSGIWRVDVIIILFTDGRKTYSDFNKSPAITGSNRFQYFYKGIFIMFIIIFTRLLYLHIKLFFLGVSSKEWEESW